MVSRSDHGVDLEIAEGASSIALAVGIYGIYVMLYVIATWTTFQQAQTERIALRMRIFAALMFTLVTAHIIIQIVYVFQPRELAAVAEPYAIGAELVIPPLAGLLSDGILAWRFLVVWGNPRWLRRTVVALLGLVGITGLAILPCKFAIDISIDTVTTLAVTWAWCFFALNTIMTGSVVLRIQSLSGGFKSGRRLRWQASIVARAIIESSLVAWIGVLSCAISWSDTPDSDTLRVDSRSFEFSPIMLTALPAIFGISQTLIIARIGVVRLAEASTPETNLTIAAFATAMDGGDTVGLDTNPRITTQITSVQGMSTGWTTPPDYAA